MKSTITLKRVCDLIPSADSDHSAARVILQEFSAHAAAAVAEAEAAPTPTARLAYGISLERVCKVYIGVPTAWCAVTDSFRRIARAPRGSLDSGLPPMTFATRQEIDAAKRLGRVIDYGIFQPAIRFLELTPNQIAELAEAAHTEIHWFEREALSTAETDVENVRSGLSSVSSALRCLRPLGDEDEKLSRSHWGGALKHETRFTRAFNLQDVYVNEADWETLLIKSKRLPQFDDPFGIRSSSPAVHMAYKAAKKFGPALKLKRGKISGDDVIAWLSGESPDSPYKDSFEKSPYKKTYVKKQLVRFLDPRHHRGKGVKTPYDVEALGSFRRDYPKHETIGDGLALIIVASIAWKADRSKSLSTILELLGFSGDQETDAIMQIIRWVQNDAADDPPKSTATNLEPPPKP